jgi:hypothetical protein
VYVAEGKIVFLLHSANAHSANTNLNPFIKQGPKYPSLVLVLRLMVSMQISRYKAPTWPNRPKPHPHHHLPNPMRHRRHHNLKTQITHSSRTPKSGSPSTLPTPTSPSPFSSSTLFAESLSSISAPYFSLNCALKLNQIYQEKYI